MARKMYRHTRRPPSRVIKAESRTHRMLEQNRVRLITVLCVMCFSFGMLALRLIEVSVIGGGDLPFKRLVSNPQLLLSMEEKKEDGIALAVQHPMPRLTIVDREGMVLAANLPTASLAANPTLIRNPEQVVKQIAPILSGVNAQKMLRDLTRPNSRFTYIKRHLTPHEQAQVHELGIPGLFFEHGTRRVYPMGDMTAHLLGYVDIDNRGISGIEQQFDKKLHYTHAGDDPLALSIDMRLQSLMHHELSETMKTFSAIGAAGLIMDVKSGELLSMVSLPSFDPHQPAKASEEQRFNRIALGTYELGSTLKTLTVALGLDSGVATIEDGYDTTQPIQIGGFRITDYHPNYRWMSVTEIFAYSSNIGTVKLLQDIGYKRQRQFITQLGMTRPVDIELPERAMPQVPAEWKPVQHVTVSYGHGISVTPLHLARAVSAIVNGGTLPTLTLLKHEGKTKAGPRVVKETTSRQMRQLMRQVVDYGTAKKARVAGYPVGGKTGTAEKIKHGRYDQKAKISAIVTMFPVDNPRYLIFVMVDEPKGTKETYGYATAGWVAAPVVSKIVSRMGPMMGIAPHFDQPNPQEVEFWAQSEQRNQQAKQAHFNPSGQGGVRAVAY